MSELKKTERIEAPMGGPVRGPMGGGQVGQKAMTFAPSAKRVVRRMTPQKHKAMVVVALAVVSVFLVSLGPRLLGGATDIVVSGAYGDGADSGAGVDFTDLRDQLLLVLAVYVGSALLGWIQGYLLNDVVQQTVLQMRSEVEDKINKLPLEFFDRQPRGELLSRVTNDIDNVQQTLQQTMSQLLTSLLTVVAVVGMMFWISPLLALIALVSVPIATFTTSRIMKRSQGQFVQQWRRTGKLNAHIEETITGHDLVTVFGRREAVERAFAEQNDALYDASWRAQFVSGLIMPVMMFVGNLNYVALAVVGGLRVTSGNLTIGDVQAFVVYARQFTQPLTTVASMTNLLQSGVASAERVFELLDADEQVPDAEPPDVEPPDVEAPDVEPPDVELVETLTGVSTSSTSGRSTSGGTFPGLATSRGGDGPGEVRFEHVSFSYAVDEPLITDLSLTASPGQTVAIVGPTGAGKTTLVNLLMRFYELDGGRITLDGVDITDLPRAQLRGRIGMVLQDAWLFEGTIRDNIAYGRPEASESDILAAARATYVDRFVASLPDGYDTVVDDLGGNLSAGERQLVTIARAFLADPSLLVLDEATSSVDTRTEVLVQHAMAALRSDRTSFVIAHRLSTIRDADLILVMEAGAIVEQGTHDDLLAADGAYARLHQAQFAAAVS